MRKEFAYGNNTSYISECEPPGAALRADIDRHKGHRGAEVWSAACDICCTGMDGLPDDSFVPDHFHYQAVYKEAGVTILYNSPFADEDATIYAITVNS